MNPNTQLTLLVLGIPLTGLIYCGFGIAVMASFPIVRDHPLIFGTLYMLIPFTIAASFWLKASAKAYRK